MQLKSKLTATHLRTDAHVKRDNIKNVKLEDQQLGCDQQVSWLKLTLFPLSAP